MFSYYIIFSVDYLITFTNAESIENKDNVPLDFHKVEVEAKSILEIITYTISLKEVKNYYNKNNLSKQKLILFLVLLNLL